MLLSDFADESSVLLECPTGWVHRPDSLNCYKLVETKLIAPDAFTNCASLGGHIAAVRDHEEAKFVIGMMKATFICQTGCPDIVLQLNNSQNINCQLFGTSSHLFVNLD